MKIAYVNLIRDSSPGIEKRIEALANGAKQAGIDEIDFYYLNRSKHGIRGRIKFIKAKETVFPLNYYNFLFRRYQIIEQNVDLNRYDYIILRYPAADRSGIGSRPHVPGQALLGPACFGGLGQRLPFGHRGGPRKRTQSNRAGGCCIGTRFLQ